MVYDNNSQLTGQMFAALHALGPRAPDIAFPYGDDSWVNSASGAWASYVLDEVIPKALKILHADPCQVAIGGISMGGFGAYAIAHLDPGRLCATTWASTHTRSRPAGSVSSCRLRIAGALALELRLLAVAVAAVPVRLLARYVATWVPGIC